MASSCCVSPLDLVAAMSDLRLPFLVASGVAVAGGWAVRRRSTACRSCSKSAAHERSRATLAFLLLATAIVPTAAAWGHIDPMLPKLARGR